MTRRLVPSLLSALALAGGIALMALPAAAQMADVDSFTAAMSDGRAYDDSGKVSSAAGAFGFTADRLVQLGVAQPGCTGGAGADWSCQWAPETQTAGVGSLGEFMAAPAVQDAALGRYLQQTWHALGADVQQKCRDGVPAPGAAGPLSVSSCLAAADIIGPDGLRSYLASGDCPAEAAAAMAGGAAACRSAVTARLSPAGGYAGQDLASYEIDMPVSTFTQLAVRQAQAHAAEATGGTSGGSTSFAENSPGCEPQTWETLTNAATTSVQDSVGRRQAQQTSPTSVLDGSCFDMDNFLNTSDVSVLYDPQKQLNGILSQIKSRVCSEANALLDSAMGRAVVPNDFFAPMGFQMPTTLPIGLNVAEVNYGSGGGYDQCVADCTTDAQTTEETCKTTCMIDPAVSYTGDVTTIKRVSSSLPTIKIYTPVQ